MIHVIKIPFNVHIYQVVRSAFHNAQLKRLERIVSTFPLPESIDKVDYISFKFVFLMSNPMNNLRPSYASVRINLCLFVHWTKYIILSDVPVLASCNALNSLRGQDANIRQNDEAPQSLIL